MANIVLQFIKLRYTVQLLMDIIFLCTTAECFMHLSHRLGVHLSVHSSHCGIVSKRHKLGSQNLHCGPPKDSRLS